MKRGGKEPVKKAAKRAPKAAVKRPTAKAAKKSPKKAARKAAAQPVLLAGGNPQIAKAEGDAPVQAYIAAIPDWKSGAARRLDALITRQVPQVRKAVKWNSPFFKGTALRPAPAGGTGKDARWIDIHEDDWDGERMADWVKQAAALPGWGKG